MKNSKIENKVRVFRSNKAIYAQVVNIESGDPLFSLDTRSVKGAKSPIESAMILGKTLAEKCKASKIESLVYDRNGYKYHGQVKALAEGLREGGIKL